ncbi:MAG: phosphomannomutase, partial [Deltaproteobacteria bacterium]|nr:phosphomannomutase [Deltaproteobacteria bacterium]
MSTIPNPHVFREYDIRGVADRDFPDDFAELLGRALGTLWVRRDARRVGVGRDCRLSSPRLHTAFMRGLSRVGLEVLDIGMAPTPLLYFTVFHYDLDGGVQITGSHNPPEDNGFKMMAGKATLSGQDIAQLRTMIDAADFVDRTGGKVIATDPTPAYVGFVRGNIRLADRGERPLRFAIDAGSGAGGPLAL